jgi:hypothetical protein
MNGRIPLALVIVLLLAALGWTGWESWQEHQQIAVLQARALSADRALDQVRKQAAQYHERLVEAAKARQEAKAADGAAKNGKKTGKNAMVDLTPYLEKEPGYAQMRQLLQLRRIAREYGDLKNLNLPPDQLDKLKALLVDRMQAPQDAREAALQAGIGENSRDMSKAVQSATEGVDADIKALVGPDQFAALTAIQMQAGYRSNIQYQIAPDMNAAGLTLTSPEIDALAQAQQQAQKAAMEAMRAGGNSANYQTILNQAMADQAAKILTPDQLPVFQQSLALNQQYSDLQNKAMQTAQKELGHSIHSWTVNGP